MYFKKLEITGFKSFLNRTKLKFEPGATAIVGPNGCGKSNIVDAIKWVFGEQSPRSMRSTLMQDVIFNGTEKQDPVNLAEVSIVLSNEDGALPVDYDEVTITRRLFRSGDSEYLINKTPVRLADVRNILMGTGLGTSSYSVIEQGKMDMVISSKPEERRYVFEEASGITRYKTRKREALLKLERTQENLVRVNDIIREVERQIKSIERQARKAERYHACYQDLKDMEVKLSYKKVRGLNEQGAGLDETMKEMNQASETLKQGLDDLRGRLAGNREEFNAVMEDLQASQNEITRLSSDIDKNRRIVEVNKERVQDLQKHAQRLDRDIEEATERKEALRGRMAGMEQRYGDVRHRRETKDAEFSSAREKVGNISQTIEQHRHELKLSREKTVDIVAEQTETRNMLIKNDADIRNMTARERRLKLERANVEREKEATREKLKIAGETVEEVRKGLEADKRKFDAFNGEYVAKQERLSLLKTEKHERERRLSGLKPRIEFFERLISEREGIGESGKEIMKRVEAGDPGFAGVRGILSEIVSVRRDYEESMESVLGDLSRAVVVDSRDVAERISGFLEENFLESMSFVILDELAAMPDGQDRRPVSDNGTLDDVTSVLVAEQPFSSAIASMLRDTFIAEAPEAARVFITENDPLVRIICKKGEIYRKGMYRSRNYSDKEVVPLFGRRERLDQMIAEERRVADEVSRMERGAGELEEWIKASRTKMGSLEDALKEKQIEYADVSSKRSVVKERSEALSDESLLLDAEIEEQSGAIGRLKEGSMGLDSRLSELEKESSGVGQKIDMSQVVIKDSSLEREKALYAISDIKAELSAMRKEEEHLAEGLVREKQDYIRLEKEVGEKGKSINECAEGITALDQEAKTLEEKITEYGDLKEIRISEDAAAKARKDDLVRCISGVEQEINENEERLESSRNRMRDIDIERKELEYKRTALVQRLSDAYKVHITGSVPEVDETFNSEEAQSRITELNNRLERMGEVSLGAVEEHKQLEERYAFLTGQREDLTKGREDVMQAIARINRTTRKLFMETFEAIKREFNVYFRMLFNGGRAELVLEDESDILESGIDIIVRPPGKKLQNITLLSGGEKAMTGIALIFAIFKVNPSPFCVLDEIDAPLDESNIVRFCRVLREFLKLSQFIIVTHNRMTIQLADVLYGITMQEKGVSKIVSVKFAEEEKQPEEENIPVGA